MAKYMEYPMYIYASYKDSASSFFSNRSTSFRVHIDPPIRLDPNEPWTCALMESDFGEDYEEKFENMYIYCDLINPSIVKGKYDNSVLFILSVHVS